METYANIFAVFKDDLINKKFYSHSSMEWKVFDYKRIEIDCFVKIKFFFDLSKLNNKIRNRLFCKN